MRREFIIVLLGIICVSTLSSILSGYMQIDFEKVLLDTVVGAVGAGNFSYWQLGHIGPLLVIVTSTLGDADIYISDNSRPSYEVDRNNLSSTTCGQDSVRIPADFPRPIGLGVFGHWSHSVSEYTIQVYLDTSTALSKEQIDEITRVPFGTTEKADIDTREKNGKKSDDENKPSFLRLLNILNMVFEMFVL